MEGFINKEYYVDCQTPEEVVEFLNMCDDADLKMRTHQRPNEYMNITFSLPEYAVFAYNLRGDTDGISMWTRHLSTSDFEKPHVPFKSIKHIDYAGINALDILSLL